MKKIFLLFMCFATVSALSGCGQKTVCYDADIAERNNTEAEQKIIKSEKEREKQKTEVSEKKNDMKDKKSQSVAETTDHWSSYYTGNERTQNTTQTEIICKVKQLDKDDDAIPVSPEDGKKIQDIIASCKYEIGTADCLNNYAFVKEDGSIIYYHAGCGTFNDNENNRSYHVTEEMKLTVNEFLSDIFVETYNGY